jgi:transposase
MSLASEVLRADPLSGHLFVFCNRRADRIKILYFDGTGLWVCAKRLEAGRYSWPPPREGRVRLSQEEFALLIGGIELGSARLKDWWRKEI